jgi:multiple sugar transport system substrate-binding protein
VCARSLLATALVLALAACGGDGGRAGGTPATTAEGGSATYCAIKLLAPAERAAVKGFNEARRDEGLSARFEVLGPAEGIPDVCDVALIDSDWLGYHASVGGLADLTGRIERRRDEFLGDTLEMARYDDRYWGIPRYVDVGFLYYHVDAGTPPLTWPEVYALGRRRSGFIYPGGPDISLTTHFLEVAYAAGGRVLSEDGTASELDSAENLRALTFMRRGIEQGAVPRLVTRMDEEDARSVFDSGASVMRNWTYAYRASRVSEWDEGTELIELPAFGDGGDPAAVLKAQIVVVAADAREEPAALALAEYLTGEEEAHRLVRRHRRPTAMSASYLGSDVLDSIPYSLELERTIEAARPLPVSPHWPEISIAIARHVRAALNGRISPREALSTLDARVNAILAGQAVKPSSQARR